MGESSEPAAMQITALSQKARKGSDRVTLSSLTSSGAQFSSNGELTLLLLLDPVLHNLGQQAP